MEKLWKTLGYYGIFWLYQDLGNSVCQWKFVKFIVFALGLNKLTNAFIVREEFKVQSPGTVLSSNQMMIFLILSDSF